MMDEPGLLVPRSRRLRGSHLVAPPVQGHQGARGFPDGKLQAAPTMLGGSYGRQWKAGGRLPPPRPRSGGGQPSPTAGPISLGLVGSSRVPCE